MFEKHLIGRILIDLSMIPTFENYYAVLVNSISQKLFHCFNLKLSN